MLAVNLVIKDLEIWRLETLGLFVPKIQDSRVRRRRIKWITTRLAIFVKDNMPAACSVCLEMRLPAYIQLSVLLEFFGRWTSTSKYGPCILVDEAGYLLMLREGSAT